MKYCQFHIEIVDLCQQLHLVTFCSFFEAALATAARVLPTSDLRLTLPLLDSPPWSNFRPRALYNCDARTPLPPSDHDVKDDRQIEQQATAVRKVHYIQHKKKEKKLRKLKKLQDNCLGTELVPHDLSHLLMPAELAFFSCTQDFSETLVALQETIVLAK